MGPNFSDDEDYRHRTWLHRRGGCLHDVPRQLRQQQGRCCQVGCHRRLRPCPQDHRRHGARHSPRWPRLGHQDDGRRQEVRRRPQEGRPRGQEGPHPLRPQRAPRRQEDHRRHPYPRLGSHHQVPPRERRPRCRVFSPWPPQGPRGQVLPWPQVKMTKSCIGDETTKMVDGLKNGECLLLENVRFFPEEEKNDNAFAKKLAAPFDMYVNDAFGTAHRAHGSTAGVTEFLKPSVAGFLLQKELDYLDGAVSNPKRPFAAIVGGSKVSSKIGVIDSLMEKCDVLVIGGGMVFTFLKARGLNVGSSLVEEDKLELAKELEAKAKAKGIKLILPSDVVLADKFDAKANTKVSKVEDIEDGWMGLDNGPEATKEIQAELSKCKTIIWNGPMGVFDMDAFAKGTNDVASTLAECTGKGAITIIGGGDSVAAVEKAGLAEKMSHISTGGGASLELLEGKVLPGVAALQEK